MVRAPIIMPLQIRACIPGVAADLGNVVHGAHHDLLG
jgi:hypothetical protein